VLKKVHIQKLKDKALMLSKPDMLHHAHNIVLIFRVLIHEEFKQFALLHGKFVVDFRVTVYFNGHSAPREVIYR
jgi:hypothetical protein